MKMKERGLRGRLLRSCAWMLVPLVTGSVSAFAADDLDYINLDYPGGEANFTGIRGANIVGNYLIPDGNGASGGILYRTDTQSWVPIPTSTPSGVNYPGVYSATPYGPTFGSPDGGVFRLVGSYKATSSSGDTGFLYDAAGAPDAQYTDIVYPSSDGVTVINTIPHSIFGNNLVGNYDTSEGEGGAFIYNTVDRTYTALAGPDSSVTTAYGIYGDKVVGGYTDAPGLDAQHGFMYDMTTDTFTTYDHPDALTTHFQGVTGAGRNGEYNLAADWMDLEGGSHAAILHINADGTTEWYELDVPGSTLTSIDSIYAGTAVGFYFTAEGEMLNYMVVVPWIYDPIRNTTPLDVTTFGTTGIAGLSGDDIVNDSTVTVSAANAVGIAADTYGVVTNNGSIVVTGTGSAGVKLDGLDSTLLNTGSIVASPGADAIVTGPDASGTMVVNTGIIDGRILFAAGPQGRFENSGWLGVTADGAGTVHEISGIFAQTSTGTLGFRVDGDVNDRLDIDGVARLGGAVAVGFSGPEDVLKHYTLLNASDGATGTFTGVTAYGLPAFFATSLGYSTDSVSLNVASSLAGLTGLTGNQRAVGAGIDRALNGTAGDALGTLPGGLAALYDLSAAQLPGALTALSGEVYASQSTILIGDSIYSRDAVLGRLRQSAYAGAPGSLANLSFGGPALAYAAPAPSPQAGASAALANVTKAPAVEPAGPVLWATGFGGWTNYDGDRNASSVDATIGGVIAGADVAAGDWRVGGALGYSQSTANVDAAGSSSQVDSFLLALYGGTRLGPLNLRLGGTYAFNQIDSDRTIAFPGFLEATGASYNGGTAQLFGEVGYGFTYNTLALEPFAGLAWVHLNTDSFTENGISVARLAGASTTEDVGYGTLGIRAATDVTLENGAVLTPHVSVAWQYAFGDTTPTTQLTLLALPQSGFTVTGVPLATNTALIEAGLEATLNATTRIGATYVGQFADSVTVNAFRANLTVAF